MSDKQLSCSELVHPKMLDRSAYLDELNNIIGDDESTEEEREEALDELNNFALEISSYKVIKILLSTGGPADWLELKVDNGEVMGLTYHYQDWFDHAETKVPEDSYLWDYALEIAQTEGY